MAELVLFHHAQGLTPGMQAFAGALRRAGHTVHTPDLYEGMTFADLGEGVAHARQIGFDKLFERGQVAVEGLPDEIVYAGFSLGAGLAQMLAETRRGAQGALLFSSAFPISEFGERWPEGVSLQIHMMDKDPWVVPPNEDLEFARDLARTVDGAELFLYPGDRHLFADSSLPDYDKAAAQLVEQRVLAFLDKVG